MQGRAAGLDRFWGEMPHCAAEGALAGEKMEEKQIAKEWEKGLIFWQNGRYNK